MRETKQAGQSRERNVPDREQRNGRAERANREEFSGRQLGKVRLVDSEREKDDPVKEPAIRERKKMPSREGVRSERGSRERKELAPSNDRANRDQMRETRQRRSQEKQKESQQGRKQDKGSLQERLAERKKKKLRRIFFCFGGVMAVIYIIVAVYFGVHFYEGTEIYGVDCSQKTAGEVKAEVAEKLQDYRLELLERGDKSELITAEQIGLEFVDNSSVDRMLKAQHSYIWPVMLMMERSSMASVAFTYDKERAVTAFQALDCMNPALVTAPKDAYIKTTDSGFEVESEVMGTMLDVDKAEEALLTSLDGGKSRLELENYYVNPEVYQDNEELQKDASAMSELARAQITYDFGTQTEVVNAPVIKDWIVELADGSFVIDDVCVTNYVESLAEKYDTFGLTREFSTSIGTVVTLTGGDYGWCIDQDATVVALLNALQEGYQGTMEPVYLYTAKSRENGDIGYTYVEVCISRQEMWCYQDGVCIVDTPVVTGNPNKGNATPSGGVWAIDAKKENAILVGEGYRSPVDYWMPFNGDVGIHDMQARAYFGGSIYLSNGSHGCVNTPYAQAQTIYNTVEVGTPVIVYD